jgi:hypothetical protein
MVMPSEKLSALHQRVHTGGSLASVLVGGLQFASSFSTVMYSALIKPPSSSSKPFG